MTFQTAEGETRLLHDRLQDLVIKPKAKGHCRDHNRDEETNAFEEDAFNNPNRENRNAVRT